ncbi:MAG: Hsp70 family protein, partial [Vogesella sp.]|uniref:Hsp70 family protein n=1 Tax=Vogesella sp. TaxID=1904252 RepID=UPI003F30238D
RGLFHDILRGDFDEAIEKQIVSIESTVARLLADAQLQAGEVDTVFFTGGSSGVPLLRERIAAMFPAARAVEGDRYGSIGSGLALDASRRFA